MHTLSNALIHILNLTFLNLLHICVVFSSGWKPEVLDEQRDPRPDTRHREVRHGRHYLDKSY